MKVILVSLEIFQTYIIDNIKQLLLHNNNDITVITEKEFFNNFDEFNGIINLIDKNNLDSSLIQDYYKNSKMNKSWRNGFWFNTSMRMFYVHAYMKTYNINDVIHIENDILIYENLDVISNSFKENKIYCCFDSPSRVILSIIYIPTFKHLEQILDNYDYNLNDMQVFGNLDKTLVETFPIIDDSSINEINIYNKNFKLFNEVIFDAAAIGQYLGGIDKFNDPNDTRGFVNETCVIKYNNYCFCWDKNEKGLWCPFIIINNRKIKIMNLHLHCKMLNLFLSNNSFN